MTREVCNSRSTLNPAVSSCNINTATSSEHLQPNCCTTATLIYSTRISARVSVPKVRGHGSRRYCRKLAGPLQTCRSSHRSLGANCITPLHSTPPQYSHHPPLSSSSAQAAFEVSCNNSIDIVMTTISARSISHLMKLIVHF